MPNKNLKYLLNPIINLITMSNRLTLTPSTTPQVNKSTNSTPALNDRKVDIHPNVKKHIIAQACHAITQHNPSPSPISCKSNLQNRELSQSANIEIYSQDLEELANDPDKKIRIFLLNSLIKVLSTPYLHIEAKNIAFIHFKNLLIHSISYNSYPSPPIFAAATQCLHIIGSTRITLANHEESIAISNQCIKLIKELYKKWDNHSKLKFLENNLDYFAADISKAASTLYLHLILKGPNSIKQSITKTIIDTIKSISAPCLLSHIKATLTKNISNCTDDALLTCKEKIVFCDKLILRNASLSDQQRHNLQQLLKDIMTPEYPYFRNEILSSDKFRSLLLLPQTNSNARTTALDIMTLLAKHGDKKEKTTIHSIALNHLLSYTSKKQTEDQLNLFYAKRRFTSAQDIATIITLSTSLHEYNDYLESFKTALEILSFVLTSLSNPDLEAFTILKLLGINPELKTFLKTSFNN